MYVHTATLVQDTAERTGRFLQDRAERARRSDDRGFTLSAEMVGLTAVVIAVALFLIKSNLGQSLLNQVYDELNRLKNRQ
ncbi:MAG TPA: hypothetical protein VHJ17_13390 [Thermomonospora sp.]|nr:hypothetical protein [Thermomonospora sp.]